MLGEKAEARSRRYQPLSGLLLHGALKSRPLAPGLLFIMYTAHVLF